MIFFSWEPSSLCMNQLKKLNQEWTSLAVQWLRLRASSVGDASSIPGQGTGIHCVVGLKNPKKQKHYQRKKRTNKGQWLFWRWPVSSGLGGCSWVIFLRRYKSLKQARCLVNKKTFLSIYFSATCCLLFTNFLAEKHNDHSVGTPL